MHDYDDQILRIQTYHW